jgi:hypothetical protein
MTRPSTRAAVRGRDAVGTAVAVPAKPFTESIGPAGDAFEREADRIAEVVVRNDGWAGSPHQAWSGASAPDTIIRRKCADCQEEEEEQIRRAPLDGAGEQAIGTTTTQRASVPDVGDAGGAAPEPASATTAPSLLVEDDADAGPGQMVKSEFVAGLRVAVCSAVDAALSGTGRDSNGCPYVDYWLGYYESREASQIERSLRRYAPEALSARSARDYIRLVTVRIRQSAELFAKTGEVTGLPDEGMTASPKVLDGVGGMFFKARPGGARRKDPASVRDQLGSGEPLPGQVRARMESAFAANFGGVRMHTDTIGARLANQLNARAFTVGTHVAFGRGEFRPGTVGGDALIAHELAHVVQQRGATTAPGVTGSAGSAGPLERDADRSAATVVGSLLMRTNQAGGRVAKRAAPALRSGLSLSRCKSEREKEVERLGDVQYAFLEKRRKEEEERLRKQAEEDAKKKGLPPPPTPPKVELSDITGKDAATHSLPASPTAEWDNVVDKPAWNKKASDAIALVEASVKGTEIEPLLKGVTIKFTPKEALEGGFYASFNSATSTFNVSMSWIRLAEKDPKNVWENIVHEAGGHRKYGKTYSSEIMDAALSKLSSAERKKVVGDQQNFFEAYSYPETEIYSAVWQRRYQHPPVGPAPQTGGIDTDVNIVRRLNVMKNVLAPEVARAVLVELKRRIDENDEILARDKKFYLDKVKEVFGFDL